MVAGNLNILMVTPGYPPVSRGGGGIVSKALAEGLAKRGHDVLVLAGRPQRMFYEKPYRSDIGRIKVFWVPLIRISGKKFSHFKEAFPPNLFSATFLKAIKYEEFDVIHLQGIGHLLIDYICFIANNSKKILTVHAFPRYPEERGNILLKLLYGVYFSTLGRHTLDSAKIVTAVSSFSAMQCIKRGVAPEKIRVIPNGIELDNYHSVRPDELARKFNIEDDDILILSISRVTWYKGFEYALEAIHRIIKETRKPIKYMIIGDLEDKEYQLKLTRQISALGLQNNVIFTGFVSEEMKLQALTRADIFLAPSLHEGFGIVILEAMALGKPIIASNCEGFRCILKNMETGILVKPASSEDIANALRCVLSNSELRSKLSENASREVKKYDWGRCVEKYEEIYKIISES